MQTFRVALPAIALLLSACAARSTIAPEEVLQYTTVANQAITSARFTVDVDFKVQTEALSMLHGDASVEGVIQHGGQQFQAKIETDFSNTDVQKKVEEWSLGAELIVASEAEIYSKVDFLIVKPEDEVFSSPVVESLLGKWWRMPASSGAIVVAGVTPDPRFLRMQADAVTVTNDKGIISLQGNKVHHYDVIVQKEKLSAFLQEALPEQALSGEFQDVSSIDLQGELWIDAKTYVIRKAVWSVHSTDESNPLDVKLTLNVSDHNNADLTITPPLNAQFIDMGSIFVPSLPQVTPLE